MQEKKIEQIYNEESKENESFYEKIKEEFQEYTKNDEFDIIKQNKYNLLSFYLGAYVCDSIIKQSDFLVTGSLIKSLSQRYQHLHKNHIEFLIKMCNQIQNKVFRKTQSRQKGSYAGIKISFLRNLIYEIIKDLEKEQKENDTHKFIPEICKIYLIYGFIIYSELFNNCRKNYFNKKDENNKESEDFGESSKDKKGDYYNNLREIINDFLAKPLYESNKELEAGIYLGILYTMVLKKQIKLFKTSSLSKSIKFSNKFREKKILNLLCDISSVIFKLAFINAKDIKKENKFQLKFKIINLYGRDFLLKILKSFINRNFKINKYLFLEFGFYIGFTIYNLSKISEIEKEILNIKEQEILKSNQEEIGWLIGELINNMVYSEKTELKTNKFSKRFLFLTNGFNLNKLIELVNELNHIQIKIFLKNTLNIDEKSYVIFPNIFFELFKKIGNLNPEKFDNSKIIVSIAKGYHEYQLKIIPKLMQIKENKN
ncbi:MAG: hypothetical protein ACTSQP_16935 [Promethearchaeota archaeon]